MKIKKEYKTLLGLEAGILLWGIAVQIIILCFAGDRIGYSIGLWIGILTAAWMVYHMQRSLETALILDADGASAKMKKSYGFRMIIVLAVFVITFFLNIGNSIAIFIGLFSVKISAYLQPLWDKILKHSKQ